MHKRNKHILLKLLHIKPLTQKELENAMLAAKAEDEILEHKIESIEEDEGETNV